MRSALTGVDIFNTVMMQRSLDKRLVVLVESPEDSGVIDPHLNTSKVQTFPGYGKESVLMAAHMFFTRQIAEVVAVVDADFDRYNGRQQQHPSNVVITEFYDLDADVIVHCPHALEAIVANFTDKTRRQSYLANHGVSMHDAVWGIATAVGEIRYCSIVRQCGLNLRGFPLHEVLKGYEQGSAQASVLTVAVARSPNAIMPTASEIATEIATISNIRHVASGHDLVSALATLIRKRWGGTVGDKLLASTLRSAVQCHCWKNTVVYRFVRDWARQFTVNAWTCP